MSKFFLCKTTDLAPGEMKRVPNETVGDLCVYNVGGTFYATADLCTHATASLSEGDIDDGFLITCPVHWGQFHIPSGKAVTFPCERNLRTYLIEIEGDDVYAHLDAEAKEALETSEDDDSPI